MNKKTRRSPSSNNAFSLCVDRNGATRIKFTDTTRERMRSAFAFRGYIAKDENTWIARLGSQLRELFSTYEQEYLWETLRSGRGSAVVVFENLPSERVEWSPVPGAPAHSAKSTSLSEHLLIALATLAGEPYGVAKEGTRVVNDLVPNKADLGRLTGNGSRMELGLHYENAALRFALAGIDLSPSGLLLTGVSAQSNGGPKTNVVCAADACRKLSRRHYAMLREPCVLQRLPLRQRVEGSNDCIGPVPLIFGQEQNESIIGAFYGDMLQPLTDEVKPAVDSLRSALEQTAFGIEILPGTCAFLANGRALHGRSSFEPEFDETGRARRWIQRIFVSARIDSFLQYRSLSDRIFDVGLSHTKH